LVFNLVPEMTYYVSSWTLNLAQLNSTQLFKPLFGGLGAMHAVRLGLIGKHVVDLLLVIIELFNFFAKCYG